MKPSYRGAYQIGLLVVVACGWVPTVASGTTYDMSPRETILLKDGARFIAQDGWNSVALYRADGSVAHGFPAPAGVGRIALSPDEKHLLVACKDGSLVLWRVGTGERAWLKGPGESGLGNTQDASFAGNGERFAVCDQRDSAVVFDTGTGRRVGAVSFPPGQTNVMSVALAPDGTRGFLVDLGERLHTFDLAAVRPVDTGFQAAWPVRFSADGRYVAFRNDNSGSAERLSVVRTDEQLTKQDLGEFTDIGHIRPAGDGSFLVTARVGGRDSDARYVGVQVWPDGGRAQEVWRLGGHQGVNERTGYDPRPMIGVSTDFRLVTRVTDLRAGKTVTEIDNSANYRPEMLSSSSVGVRPERLLLWVSGAVLGMLITGAMIWRRRRPRR
jgi:hypothetical protein